MTERRREIRICPRCGSQFEKRPSDKAVYCSRSCGSKGHTRTRKHNMSESREFKSWWKMRQRCENQNDKDYPYYGARGVTVCDRWTSSFKSFLEDMGPRPEGTSIDRLDGTKGYEPGNCRWATRFEQTRNRSISWTESEDQVLRDGYGRRLPQAEIAKLVGKSRGAIAGRAHTLGLRMGRWPSSSPSSK